MRVSSDVGFGGDRVEHSQCQRRYHSKVLIIKLYRENN
jgi:hypothetical protein